MNRTSKTQLFQKKNETIQQHLANYSVKQKSYFMSIQNAPYLA